MWIKFYSRWLTDYELDWQTLRHSKRTWDAVVGSFRIAVVVVVRLSDASRYVIVGRVRRRVAFPRDRDVKVSGGSDVRVEVGSAAEPVAGRQSELVAGGQKSLADGAAEAVDVEDEMASSHDEVTALERHRTRCALCREPSANSHQHHIFFPSLRIL